MHRRPGLLALAAAATLPAVLPAQAPLRLDVVGGSMPGTLAIDVYPGSYPLEACFVLPGSDPGPTFFAQFGLADPRFVQVGTAMLANSFFGLLGLDGHYRIGPVPVPLLPSLVDQPFFFQAITLPGANSLVDRISNPAAIRMAAAALFRDRGVFLADERAFGIVLPRADRRWMIVGGGRGGLLSQVAHRTTEIYDDVTDAFVYGPQMTTERSLHVATQLRDGRWLITGGVDAVNNPQASCEIYDPATDAFAPVAPMLSPRMGHSAALLPDGRVFVAGGLAAMTVVPSPLNAIYDTVATTEIYNPATNAWTAGPNMRTPRAGHVAILRPDGRVLLAGGISWDDFILFRLPAVRANSDVYDPATNTMANGPSMATAHALIDPVPIGGDRWLVAGGISNFLATDQTTNACEVYDAVANTFAPTGSMATSRGIQRSWALGGGRFLVAGGANGNLQNTTGPTPLASTEIYDAATGTFAAGPPLTVPRAAPGSLLTPRGQVHLMGGGTTLGATATSCEWYYF